MNQYSYRGRNVTEKQYQKLVMRREHGVCPLCERAVTECYGNMGKHIRSCVKLMGWDKNEQEFPMWQIGLAEYPTEVV